MTVVNEGKADLSQEPQPRCGDTAVGFYSGERD